MPHCRKCKKEIPDNSNYCNHCGAKQNLSKTPKNRGNGTGSVYKEPNGTYRAVVVLGYMNDENGNLRKKNTLKKGF